MPLKGARYKIKTLASGAKVRLAVRGNRVIEAKNLSTGEKHTPEEFARNKAGKRLKRVRDAVRKARRK